MDAEQLGEFIINTIIESGLVHVDPDIISHEFEAGLMIWSANASQQIGHAVLEKLQHD